MANGYGGNGYNRSLINELCRYRHETVTIFTESGGRSGSGFTGVLMDVNCDFVRLMTRAGAAPESPFTGLEDTAFGNGNGNGGYNGVCTDDTRYEVGRCPGGHRKPDRDNGRVLGSVCDIPIRQIVAFCHNAI